MIRINHCPTDEASIAAAAASMASSSSPASPRSPAVVDADVAASSHRRAVGEGISAGLGGGEGRRRRSPKSSPKSSSTSSSARRLREEDDDCPTPRRYDCEMTTTMTTTSPPTTTSTTGEGTSNDRGGSEEEGGGRGEGPDESFLRRRDRRREETRRRDRERERWSVRWSPSATGGDNDGGRGGGGGEGKRRRDGGRGGGEGTTAAAAIDVDATDDEDNAIADEGGSIATTDVVVYDGWGCGFLTGGTKKKKAIFSNGKKKGDHPDDDDDDDDDDVVDDNRREDDAATDIFSDDETTCAQSEVRSEASLAVLWRYMGLSSRPYMTGGGDSDDVAAEVVDDADVRFIHDLRVGDHVIRWKMLGYLYPIQVHGIVFSAGPDFVTIVDCGLSSYGKLDKVGSFGGGGEDEGRIDVKRTERRRMQIVTLVDEGEIKKWTKIRYGEEVQLRVHSSNEEMQKNNVGEDDVPSNTRARDGGTSDAEFEHSPSAGLDVEEVEKCVQAKIRQTPPEKPRSPSWFRSCGSPSSRADDESRPTTTTTAGGSGKAKQETTQRLRLPEADPPQLVLARLRFLLEYGEGPFPPPGDADVNDVDVRERKSQHPNLLPPHHLLYANSECIAVFCKTGRWSTIQAAIFLHSSTVGNVKQTATVAMFLGSQTVTVPASGLWGWFGGTTTLPLFTAQPWLVPALVGGGMVYVGLPMLMLWKAKGTWAATERRLNDAFWSMNDHHVFVDMIRSLSGLGG